MPLLDNTLNKSLAVLCNYKLDSNRVGGMDYFFWEFDSKCRERGYSITWFFPNKATHGFYAYMNIYAAQECQSIENCFLNHIKQHHFDYVLTHFLELCTPFYKKVKQLSRAKIIAVDHNPRPLGGYSLKKKCKKIVYSFLFGLYIDQFVAVSDQTRKDLHQDFPFIKKSKISVIHNGLLIDNIKQRILLEKPKIHFVSTSHLRPEKGVINIIQAVLKLPKKYHSKMLVDIYGDGPEMDNLKLLILQSNLKDIVSLKGSSDKIQELYANYDYLIHPSYAETFCYSVVESLLANVPVITTEKAGNILNLITAKNGFVFPIGDITKLSNIMLYILENDLLKIINTRSELKEQFSIEKMVENYLNLI